MGGGGTMVSMARLREERLRCGQLEAQAHAEGWLRGRPHCGVVFDGILCWNASLAGSELTQPCPAYVHGFRTEAGAVASKACGADGQWQRGRAHGLPWTNFSLCEGLSPASASASASASPAPAHDLELLQRWTPTVKRLAQVGYSVSLAALLVALCVLSCVKRLRCPRNTLHRHLFASFLLRASASLLKDALFVQGLGLPRDVRAHPDGGLLFLKGKNWECKVLTSLWQYFIMANYSWILMEGLYLHNLVFRALFTDNAAIHRYVVLGWGLPLACVAPWAAGRALLEDDFCWTTNSTHLFLLIRLPIVLSVLVSFGLFVNTSRVLLTKLRGAPSMHRRRRTRYRRFARSTLLLVPLFGAHYAAFLAMSCAGDRLPALDLAWLLCDQFFASFQGLFVALLYCLLNGEVRDELVRQWRLRRDGGGSASARCSARGASLPSVLAPDALLRMTEMGQAPVHPTAATAAPGSPDQRARRSAA